MIRHGSAVETRGGENLNVSLLRGPSWRIKIRRHHADDLIKVGVHPHAPAQDVWIASEPTFPEPITDNDFPIEAGGVIFGIEGATQLRLDAKQGEIIRRDDQQSDPRRFG